MSQLKEGLNKILVWLHQQQEKYPDLTQNKWLRHPQEKYAKPYLKPKLSQEQLSALFDKLNLKLNEKICL